MWRLALNGLPLPPAWAAKRWAPSGNRPAPGPLHAGVWDVVCLTAVAGMDQKKESGRPHPIARAAAGGQPGSVGGILLGRALLGLPWERQRCALWTPPFCAGYGRGFFGTATNGNCRCPLGLCVGLPNGVASGSGLAHLSASSRASPPPELMKLLWIAVNLRPSVSQENTPRRVWGLE